jgi:hypothetical protein
MAQSQLAMIRGVNDPRVFPQARTPVEIQDILDFSVYEFQRVGVKI